MKSLVGREVAGYQILGELGQGGGGVVYRAVQVSLRRDVALKVIQEAARDDEEAARRFKRETALHMQLDHPNLVRVFDSGLSEVGPYLAMELVDGQSLGRLLKVTPQPPMGSVVLAAKALAEALAYLHAENVLHRDIKPGNILVSKDGGVKLADFGLARKDTSTLITMDCSLLGTLGYMAPEVVRHEGQEAPADVYALGLVVLEMLLGRPVIAAGELGDVIDRILNQPTPSARDAGRDDLPERLEQLLERMVAKDPAQRPPALQAVESLSELARGLGLGGVKTPFQPGQRRLVSGAHQKSGRTASRPKFGASVAIDRSSIPAGSLSWIREGPGRVAAAALVVTGVTVGILLGMKLGPDALPVPAPSTSPATEVTSVKSKTLEWMRARCAEIQALIDRYDRGAPQVDPDTQQFHFRSDFLGDSFFRAKNGDLTLIFTGLNRMTEVLERGDAENLDDPVWYEVDRVGYELIEESARSNGFDSKSMLRRAIDRLQQQTAAGCATPTRESTRASLLSMTSYFETLSTKHMLGHFDQQLALLARLDALPEQWRTSAAGCVIRYNLYWRTIGVMDAWLPRMDKATVGQGRERLRKLVERALDDLARPGQVDHDLPGEPGIRLRWCAFDIATYGLDQCWGDVPRIAVAASVLNRLAPKRPHEGLPPRDEDDVDRAMMFIHQAMKRTPPPPIDAALVKHADAVVGASKDP